VGDEVSIPGGGLPPWDSEELVERIRNYETRLVYRVLRESPAPLTMQDIRAQVAQYGVQNEQMDRRVRDLRTWFRIPAMRSEGGEYVYSLGGWHPEAGARTARGRLSSAVVARVWENYGARCAWCGRTPTDDGVRLVIDHRVPLELGGTNELENLQLLCYEHNHDKKARFAEYAGQYDAIAEAINLGSPHERIGELLKAMAGDAVPVDLINLVAREENRGDPTRRMRELRALGWKIDVTRRKEGVRTVSYYILLHWEPWPAEGPKAVINRMEADRKRRKRMGEDS
jgi:hypothetical protein